MMKDELQGCITILKTDGSYEMVNISDFVEIELIDTKVVPEAPSTVVQTALLQWEKEGVSVTLNLLKYNTGNIDVVPSAIGGECVANNFLEKGEPQ